ncbi:MAG: putative metalloprotease CJM1_0395 family protein [Sulfurimonas sp.]|uniref:putative metalloprotease CJM1_0395 family protein n=1 Tax=Sulfurimonas sp. TaxID=2022749 RepID=UPI0028CCE2EA|nr:putative metalloprotease CJM1_0395 family protein [Sulfurimonas sp.]MDT8337807.1 putative metalloprotease CJM1_0395 family protein [Sulfurimonas sp.]
MEIGTTLPYEIGINYSIKLNEKEILVFEDDPLRESKTSDEEKLEKEREQREAKETSSADKLCDDEKRLVYELSSRDTEVRAHEAAHQAAGGGMTGAASYSYQQGPDGRMYAIGGEVSISIPSGSSPQESMRNAQQAIAAAMAPADPSGQDFGVASSAMVMLIKAQQQLLKETQEGMLGKEVYKGESEKNAANKKDTTNLEIPT